jgi:hypothetical protein
MMMPPAVLSSASILLTTTAIVERTEFHATLLGFYDLAFMIISGLAVAMRECGPLFT